MRKIFRVCPHWFIFVISIISGLGFISAPHHYAMAQGSVSKIALEIEPTKTPANPAKEVVTIKEAANAEKLAKGPVLELREGKTPQVHMRPADALIFAEKLIGQGKFDVALEILESLKQAKDEDINKTQLAFLEGLVALEVKDYAKSTEIFRTIIDNNPQLVRVRLELARSLFAQKRDRAAAYHFRLVLAGDVPEETIQKIKVFLWVIQQRKIWRINASASIVPDTNVSAGPRNSSIELFGLPFELDEDAQASSGIGLTTSLLGAIFPRISKFWKFEARTALRYTDYSNSNFDDFNGTVEAGPRFESKDLTISILASANRRIFGGNGFNRSVGGRISIDKGLNDRTFINIGLGGSSVRYDNDILRNGGLYYFAGTIQRALNARSLVRSSLTITREQTRESTLQNTIFQFRGGYRRELPFGISAEVGPELYFRRFDSFDDIDGVRREDWTYGASVSITKRDWRFWGFAPVFSYQYLRNDSNADRFDFNRHRANIGVTRQF